MNAMKIGRRKLVLTLLTILIIGIVIYQVSVLLYTPNETTWKIGTKNYPYIFVNQVGYLANHKKYAIVRTNLNLLNYKYTIRDVIHGTEINATITRDLGAGYGFKHHYLLEFNDLLPGTYVIIIGNATSTPFTVLDYSLFSNLTEDVALFFELNRCGKATKFHEECHIDDGIIYNGPLKGTHVNITRGWHDAGDYLKFTSTIAQTVILLEETLLYGRPKNKTIIVREILWGLDFLEKTWIPEHETLIYMVGNQTDHELGFRLPEEDTLRNRPIYVCEENKGANIAGLVSSALSLGYILQSKSLINESENNWLDIALEVYNFGLRNLEVQENGLGDWIAYPEYGFEDDMALASILLYNITKNQTYYQNAVNFHTEFYQKTDVSTTVSNIFATLHLSENGYESTLPFYGDIEWFWDNANHDPLYYPYDEYFWSSVPAMVSVAVETWAYEKISEDSQYNALIDYIHNYIFGINQWGISFVSGYGNIYPKNLHHQILYLRNITIPGILAEGGAPKSLLEEYGIYILPDDDDPFALFQSNEAFYQDVYWNYITNEPTIRTQAYLIFFISTCLSS